MIVRESRRLPTYSLCKQTSSVEIFSGFLRDTAISTSLSSRSMKFCEAQTGSLNAKQIGSKRCYNFENISGVVRDSGSVSKILRILSWDCNQPNVPSAAQSSHFAHTHTKIHVASAVRRNRHNEDERIDEQPVCAGSKIILEFVNGPSQN